MFRETLLDAGERGAVQGGLSEEAQGRGLISTPFESAGCVSEPVLGLRDATEHRLDVDRAP